MRYYAGLDVSLLEETAACVVDEGGGIVKELRTASEPEALVAALRQIDLPLARIGLDGGPNTAKSPERVNRVVPVGTTGEAISLRVSNMQAQACKTCRRKLATS
jgi:hypothetical protein